MGRCQIRFIADDGPDAGSFHSVVKRHRAEHISIVGDRTCRHLEFIEPLGKRFELDSSLQEAIIGMKVKVNEVFFAEFKAAHLYQR